jgi:hypothetical protein
MTRPVIPCRFLIALCLALSCGAWAADVAPGPFFERYCLDCHDKAEKKGALSLDGVTTFKAATPETWASVREQLLLGQMPPKKKTQPGAGEKRQIADWIASSLRADGHHVVDWLGLPNYANRVPHEALFRSPPHPAPATLVRIWRKRPAAYAARNPSGIQPFSMLPGQQITDYGTLYSVDEPSAEIVLRNAQQLIDASTRTELRDGKVAALDAKSQSAFFPILHSEKAPTPEQFQQVMNWQFQQILQRAPTEEELTRIRKLHDDVSAAHGRLQGARAALIVPLLMPESLYRFELGSGPLDEHGRRRLTKPEILAALQHTLFTVAGQPALEAARRGDGLTTREEVAALVMTLLDGKRPNGRVLDFFDEYFNYRKATDVFKEPPANADFNAGNLVRDTQRLIETIVGEDKEVLRRLLTTTQTYINDDSDLPRGHRSYNLPPDWKWRDGLIDLPADERAGILTQPAWLVAHSGNFDNDPVRRGKWILDHLLGGVVTDIPISVCAVVPEDKQKTLRERFEVIRNKAYCWKCHYQMNPLGMAFENYDHFGRHRLMELDRPVNATGAVVDIGDKTVDGEVSNPIELIHRLAKSKRSQEMFVRYAFRFFLGRNETIRDAKTLQEADQAYEKSGGSMKALVVSLLSSDSFLYRAPDL